MSDFYHDSFEPRCRAPFGAVTPGTPVTLRIDAPPDCTARLRVWTDHETILDGEREGGSVAFTYVPQAAGLHWYSFMLQTPSGPLRYAGGHGAGRVCGPETTDFHITVYEPWAALAGYAGRIAYQIFPDRFFGSGLAGLEKHRARGRRVYAHGSWRELPDYMPRDGAEFYEPVDYFGGTLDGIREKLPYLAALSVGVIYLNPVFEAASNHRYNTADYMAIDPVLGTEDDLRRLCGEAAALGMRIMLDGVFSHTGDDSVYFDARGTYGGGALAGPDSPYRSWYGFAPDGSYKSWWGFKSLPEVNENDAGYRAFISRVLKKWASFGLTLWRLDVADELPDGFIGFLRRELKALDRDAGLIGEVWEDASTKTGPEGRRRYTDGHELDGVMNYPRRAALFDFLLGRITADALADFLRAEKETYPPPFYDSLLNSLSTHDTQRALTVLSGAVGRDALPMEEQAHYEPPFPERGKRLMKAAVLMQFALPGVPCVYYGDETGMTGMADPFSRLPFPWDDIDAELLEYTRALAACRKNSEALTDGPSEFIALSDEVIAIRRGNTLAAVNRGASAYALTLGGLWRDAVTGTEYGGSAAVPPESGLLIEKIYSTNDGNVVY